MQWAGRLGGRQGQVPVLVGLGFLLETDMSRTPWVPCPSPHCPLDTCFCALGFPFYKMVLLNVLCSLCQVSPWRCLSWPFLVWGNEGNPWLL